MKHKSKDYKISPVKYYIKNKVSMDKTCKIFDCKKTSLKRWINRYNLEKSIKRHNRKSISYKISKEQVKYSLKLLKNNEQITMEELVKLVKVKFTDFTQTTIERKCSLPDFHMFNILIEQAMQKKSLQVRLLGIGVKFIENSSLFQLEFNLS